MGIPDWNFCTPAIRGCCSPNNSGSVFCYFWPKLPTIVLLVHRKLPTFSICMVWHFSKRSWGERAPFCWFILLLGCCSIEKLGWANALLCIVSEVWVCINVINFPHTGKLILHSSNAIMRSHLTGIQKEAIRLDPFKMKGEGEMVF